MTKKQSTAFADVVFALPIMIGSVVESATAPKKKPIPYQIPESIRKEQEL